MFGMVLFKSQVGNLIEMRIFIVGLRILTFQWFFAKYQDGFIYSENAEWVYKGFWLGTIF